MWRRGSRADPPKGVKRSRRIRLVLLGGLSAGALTGCGPTSEGPGGGSASAVYTNNHHIAGVGYYHAPYRGWFPQPYNSYDPNTRQYFHGGQWTATPHQSVTNISAPTGSELKRLAAATAAVHRGGWGSSGHRHGVYS